MVLGLGIKMALFPLHGWLPDAYTHAPSASSSIMAPIGVKIGAYGILRILFFVFGLKFVTQVFPIAQIITWLSAAGIIYGSILALSQDEMKRMLAYSSISQIGYIGLGIGLANPYGIIGESWFDEGLFVFGGRKFSHEAGPLEYQGV
jgi:multicomponent Na+:H+ antiporter subunit D